jgi:CrcB protein
VSPPVLLAVGLVGGLGAIARFELDGAVGRRLGRELPFGTFAVNVSGAFALGVLAGAALTGDAYRIAGTGFLGAFTTFSTRMFESHRLGEDGRLRAGALNLAVSLAAGLAAAWLGRHLGAALKS